MMDRFLRIGGHCPRPPARPLAPTRRSYTVHFCRQNLHVLVHSLAVGLQLTRAAARVSFIECILLCGCSFLLKATQSAKSSAPTSVCACSLRRGLEAQCDTHMQNTDCHTHTHTHTHAHTHTQIRATNPSKSTRGTSSRNERTNAEADLPQLSDCRRRKIIEVRR